MKKDWKVEFGRLNNELGYSTDDRQIDFIEKLLAEAIQECIDLSDEIELREPDDGTKQWMAFKTFRNTMRYRLKALKNKHENT